MVVEIDARASVSEATRPHALREIIRIVKSLAEQGRWRKIILVTQKSLVSSDPRVVEYRLRAAIELNDSTEIARCTSLVIAIQDMNRRVKFASILVNANRPVEAAQVLNSVPVEFSSAQASRIFGRILASGFAQEELKTLSHHRRPRATKVANSAEVLRFPGDVDEYELPADRLRTVRMAGVDEGFEKHIHKLWGRFNERVGRRPFPFVREFRDVFVNQDGAILSPDGTLFKMSAAKNILSLDPTAVPIYDNAYLCTGFNRGYYDWLLDRLSKLSWSLAPGNDTTILVRKEQRALAIDAVTTLGGSPDRVVVVEGAAFCRKLYLGSSAIQTLPRKAAYYHSYGRLIEEAAGDSQSTPKRVYISRRDTARRSMLNESDFECAMLEHGITPVVLSKLTLREKVALFHNADIVIGAHGAGLSHLVFGKPSLRVIELMPAAMSHVMQMNVRVCFSMISRAFGLDHRMILYPANPMGSAWAVDDKIIASVIEQANGS